MPITPSNILIFNTGWGSSVCGMGVRGSVVSPLLSLDIGYPYSVAPVENTYDAQGNVITSQLDISSEISGVFVSVKIQEQGELVVQDTGHGDITIPIEVTGDITGIEPGNIESYIPPVDNTGEYDTIVGEDIENWRTK